MQNPYYVQQTERPMDYTRGLSGISNTVGQIGERKRQEAQAADVQAKQTEAKKRFMEIYDSGDMRALAEFGASNPKLAEGLKTSMKFRDDETEQNYHDTNRDILAHPENVIEILEDRLKFLGKQGAAPEDMAETRTVLNTLKKKRDDIPPGLETSDGMFNGQKFDVKKDDPLLTEKQLESMKKDYVLTAPKDDVERYLRSIGEWESEDVKDTRTTDIKNYEYGKDNPDFVKNGSGNQYEGLSSGYETYLRGMGLQNTPDNYKAFNRNQINLKKELKDNTDQYPLLSEMASMGWSPSGRVTGPMLAFWESAARRAKEKGEDLTPEKMRAMEFQAQKNRSTGAAAGSRLVIGRKQNITAAVGILDDLQVTSHKLNYSPIKFKAAFERFQKDQTGDPIFTEYMAQRADSLFILGNALKQNGLTDKSIEIEEEAFRPTLSGAAFDAWLNTQRRAINRAAEEMNEDYRFGLTTTPTYPAGQGGAPTRENPIPSIGGKGRFKEGQTATGPNGRIIYRNGKWGPA